MLTHSEHLRRASTPGLDRGQPCCYTVRADMAESETTTTCPRHPKIRTALRCASCGTLICPECMVSTPVGAKCGDCASQRSNRLFTLTPLRALLVCLTGAALGAVAGWGVEFLGFFIIFAAVAYGSFAGEMMLRAAGRKRGIGMEIIAGASMFIGAIAGRLIVAAVVLSAPGQVRPPLGIFYVIADLVSPTPIPVIALAVAVAAAVSRIRYI